MVDAEKLLTKLGELEPNWNGYGADPVPMEVIVKAKELAEQLPTPSNICPTANHSVQFEWYGKNKEYLEIEVFEDSIDSYWEVGENHREHRDVSSGVAVTLAKVFSEMM